MGQGGVIAKFAKSSIVSEYKKSSGKSSLCRNQKELKEELLNTLKKLGYEYRPDIRKENDLIENLRIQLENLNSKRINGFKFTDNEWRDFFNKHITGSHNWGFTKRTEKIQGDKYQVELNRDDNDFINIRFIDKINPENNFLQVIDQYEDPDGISQHDLIILSNGIPVVQIEIRKKGTPLKEAFLEKESYTCDGLHRLFEFIQIYVISNGSQTKYYSNTIKRGRQAAHKDTNSFLFTSYWSSSNNEKIEDLMDFASSFLYPKVIRNILTKYCVFDSQKKLKILRPYQIEAIERIVDRVKMSINLKTTKQDAGGYIWHTTGSGKTLTSFKASQLLSGIKDINKIMFVVDRKDLDHQTCKEYNNYEQGCVDRIKSSNQLYTKLTSPEAREKIIITTIQKLSRLFGDKGKLKGTKFDEKVVIIMDECHRSQAGLMHHTIVDHFKNASIFGFTGTPILGEDDKINTQKIFGPELHSYKICDAIGDKNVLPFNYEYGGTKRLIGVTELTNDDLESHRKLKITQWIIKNFNNKTANRNFNSIFATDSIDSAIEYYQYFEREIKKKNENLKIAMIFSYGSDNQEHLDEDKVGEEINPLEINGLPVTQREWLNYSIERYEKMFNVSVDMSNGLDFYHADISEKMKQKKIDILIVVNMFLTGFDAPTLNTLWVDKNLREHGLIQAFSRTNRIYNDSKPFGNIISFRDLRDELSNAIEKFAGDSKIVKSPSFKRIYKDYINIKNELEENFPLVGENMNISEENDEIEFCRVFGELIKIDNQLRHYSEFEEKEKLRDDVFQTYKSKYLDIVEKITKKRSDPRIGDASGFDEIDLEIEILDSQIVDIDHIHKLLGKIRNAKPENREIEKKNCMRVVKSDASWRKIHDLIESYIDNHIDDKDLLEHLKDEKEKELNQIIDEENLKKELTHKFINEYFSSGKETISWEGTKLRSIMPVMSFRTKAEENMQKRNRVKQKLEDFFDRFKNRGI